MVTGLTVILCGILTLAIGAVVIFLPQKDQ